MTFFIDNTGPLVIPRIVGEDVETGLGDYMGAKFGQMWDSNPVPSINRFDELTAAMYGKVVYSGDAAFGLTAEVEPPKSSPLAEDEQKQRFADAGLEAHLKPHKDYTPEAVDILIDRKKTELARQDAVERASNWYAPAGIVAGLGAAALDPLNVATAFIPVVGEARLVTMLGRAGGALGRAGVRAGVGAVDGLAGAALIEPFTAAAALQEQADYGMTDAMLNVGFGAFFGAGLHAGGGALGDTWRSLRGTAQPWEAAVRYESEATAALRADFQNQLHTAHPNLTPEQAGAASALFDARARTWGRDFLRPAGEYYERYAPAFLRSGDEMAGFPEPLAARSGTEGEPSHRGETLSTESPAEHTEGEMLFQAAKKSIYSDDRSIKMTFEETGIEPSLHDRGRLKSYLQSLAPEEVAALKVNNPDAYLHKLKEIVDAVFPDESGLRFRTEEGVFDFEHFLKDRVRQDYIETLPNTLKNEDIRVEFTTPEGEAKAYLVKKYFDPQTQKDIWDLLVIRDGELKTKFAREGQKGRGYVESRITGAGNEASRSATPPEPVESASTQIRDTVDNIDPATKESKSLMQKGPAGSAKPRASVSFGEDGKAVVRFFESADATSAPHEIFHVFRRELAESAASPQAPAQVRRDWQQVQEFVGAKEGEAWTAKMEETFAREGEAFLLRGKAPSPELVGVFARLKEWFTEVYRSVRGEMNVSPAMREVFERMLATSDEADRGVSTLLRALDGNPRSAELRAAYAQLTPEERQEVFRVALAQAHQGLPIDVEALVLRDAAGVRAVAEAPALDAARVREELGQSAEANAALRDAAEDLESSRAALEQTAPELRQEMDVELAARLAEHDAALARIDLEEKALLAAAECDMRR